MPDPNESNSIAVESLVDKNVGIGNQPRVLVCVCTLNEAANIESLIHGVRAALPDADVLVVDDDSPDRTAELVQKIAEMDPAVRVFVRKGETGLGSAIRFGMSVALEEGYCYFLNMDGDLSHDPDQLPALFELAMSKQVDVVIGSRYVAGGSVVGWSLHRRLMSRFVNWFATGGLGLAVKDCSGSFRCYRVETLQKLGLENLQSNGYAVLEEVLVRLQRQGASMAEVPIDFNDRKMGKSKLTAREALRSLFQIFSMLGK